MTRIQTVGTTSTFHYCKLAAGATACSAPFSYSDGEQDVDGGYALLAPDGRVLLVEARGVAPNRAKLLWTSSNGGASFSGPSTIGVLADAGGSISGRALHAPAGALGLGAESVMTIGELSGLSAPFQATGTIPGTASAAADLVPNFSADIALQRESLIAVLGALPELRWSRYAGPAPATLDTLNDAANWTATEAIGPRSAANLETSLVSGPGGAYVGYAVDGSDGSADFVVRRFTGTGWGATTRVASGVSKPDLHADPAGRLHALWVDTAGLRYRYTTNDANTSWSAPQTVAAGESFGFPRLAVNAAGIGWAVYAGGTSTRAVPLTRGTFSGATRGVDAAGFGGTYNLRVPRTCVAAGQRFRVTLTWKRQRRKGNLFVKVRRSDFYLGSRVVRVDNRVPFVHTYNVAVTSRPGSTIRLRARAFIKVSRGTSPKKSIRANLRVCG